MEETERNKRQIMLEQIDPAIQTTKKGNNNRAN